MEMLASYGNACSNHLRGVHAFHHLSRVLAAGLRAPALARSLPRALPPPPPPPPPSPPQPPQTYPLLPDRSSPSPTSATSSSAAAPAPRRPPRSSPPPPPPPPLTPLAGRGWRGALWREGTRPGDSVRRRRSCRCYGSELLQGRHGDRARLRPQRPAWGGTATSSSESSSCLRPSRRRCGDRVLSDRHGESETGHRQSGAAVTVTVAPKTRTFSPWRLQSRQRRSLRAGRACVSG